MENKKSTKRKTTEQVLEEFNIIHNNFYTYQNLNYINNRIKITINCPIHGDFQQTPKDHLNGRGCWDCYKDSQKMNSNVYFKRVNEKHNSKYKYFNDYNGSRNKIKIECPEHGIFYQLAQNHIKGAGCIKCSGNYNYTTEEFNKKSNIIHNNKYEYPSEYKYSDEDIIIICSIHGKFKKKPYIHLQGQGCPYCIISKGEDKTKNILDLMMIKYETQKTFDGCKHKNKLKFDFYLPDYNTCIEYDGKQHFFIYERFGGISGFNDRLIKDKIKDEYCYLNNIHLLRIKYNENIEEKLSEFLLCHNKE